MTVLDENSKNIPDGVYLEISNLLQKFKFSSQDENEDINNIITVIARREGDNLNVTIFDRRNENNGSNNDPPPFFFAMAAIGIVFILLSLATAFYYIMLNLYKILFGAIN